MDNIILDMSEVDEQFINEIKSILQNDIRTSIECAYEQRKSEKDWEYYSRRSKLKQFALKLVNEFN